MGKATIVEEVDRDAPVVAVPAAVGSKEKKCRQAPNGGLKLENTFEETVKKKATGPNFSGISPYCLALHCIIWKYRNEQYVQSC